MTGTTRSTPLTTSANVALMFPLLSAAQIARIASNGVIRPTTLEKVLIEGGQTNVPFFVVKAGEIEVIRRSGLGDLLIAVVRANQFTGDISMILGRPAQMHLRVSESGEVIQLTATRCTLSFRQMPRSVVEGDSPGGQAASSSRIENYLGFPTGISGQELAQRAYAQAQKFGAEVMIAKKRC